MTHYPITDWLPEFAALPIMLPVYLVPAVENHYVPVLAGKNGILPCLDGNPTMGERMDLLRLTEFVGARSVFEIGTFDGVTAGLLASLPAVTQVWTLNLPADTNPVMPVLVSDWRFINAPRPAPWLPKVTQLWGDSAAFDYAPYAGRQDLVFVMGAHSPAYIENDLAAAFSLVALGGTVVWHGGQAENVQYVPAQYDLFMMGSRMARVTRN